MPQSQRIRHTENEPTWPSIYRTLQSLGKRRALNSSRCECASWILANFVFENRSVYHQTICGPTNRPINVAIGEAPTTPRRAVQKYSGTRVQRPTASHRPTKATTLSLGLLSVSTPNRLSLDVLLCDQLYYCKASAALGLDYTVVFWVFNSTPKVGMVKCFKFIKNCEIGHFWQFTANPHLEYRIRFFDFLRGTHS